jgi:hypothetical protein
LIPAILFFLVLSAPPLFLSVYHGKRFEETISLTTGSLILFMYLCGIFGLLKVSVFLILGIALSLLILSACRVFKTKNVVKSLASFATPAALAFFLIYIFLLYAHYERLLHEYDEFTHWGDVVKAMAYIDDFSTSPLSHSYFQNYVPGMALFQYLFEKLAMILPGGIFVDWRLYFAYHLLAVIFLLPFLTVQKWRYFLPAFLLILFIAVAPSFFDSEGQYLTSIYVDGFLGLLAGTGFATLFLQKGDPWKTAHMLVICALLVLTKDVGLLFAIVLGVAFLLTEMQRNRKTPRKLIPPAILTVAAVALPKIFWEISIQVNHATMMKFRRPIKFDVLFRVITGQETTGYEAEVAAACVDRLWTGIVGFHGPFEVKTVYPLLVAILIGLLWLAWACWKKLDPEGKPRYRIAVWGMVITLVLYCLGMPLLYMFKLDSDTLVSFERYMGIVLVSMIVMIFLLFAVWMQERPKRMIAGVAAGVMISLMTLNPVLMEKYLNRTSIGDQYFVQGFYEQFVWAMNDIADGEEKHVWIIAQESAGSEFWTIRYGIRPSNGQVNVGFSISDHTQSLYPGDIWTLLIPTEEWREKLKDYDYVMIWRTDDIFIEDYSSLFANPDDIEDKSIFAVNHETDLLERVY